MKSLREIDSVGWGTFSVLALALLAPSMYLSYTKMYQTSPVSIRLLSGVFLAAVIAAVVTYAVNEIIFRLRRKQFEEERKAERRAAKSKKKKKKKKR